MQCKLHNINTSKQLGFPTSIFGSSKRVGCNGAVRYKHRLSLLHIRQILFYETLLLIPEHCLNGILDI